MHKDLLRANGWVHIVMMMSASSDQENVDPGMSFDPSRLKAIPTRMRIAPMNSPLTSHLSPIKPRARQRSSKSSRLFKPLVGQKNENLVTNAYIYNENLEKKGDEATTVSDNIESGDDAKKQDFDTSTEHPNYNEEFEDGGEHTKSEPAKSHETPIAMDMQRSPEDNDSKSDIGGPDGTEEVGGSSEIEEASARALFVDVDIAHAGGKIRDTDAGTTGEADSDKLNTTMPFLNRLATNTRWGCLAVGTGAVRMFYAATEMAASRVKVPTFCLINCPASVLFCCITEDAPDFPHVNDWVKEDESRKIYCRKLRRHYRKAKRRAYVYIKQSCFGVRAEVEIMSKEDKLFEERRIARLEARNSLRMARASKMVEEDRQKKEAEKAEDEEKAAASKKEEVVVYRAPPVRSNKTVMSAMDRAIIARRVKDCAASTRKTDQRKSARPRVKNDRFSMVENALEKQCYTTDGKRFFRSKRQLDAHFLRLARAGVPNSSTGAAKQQSSSRRTPLKSLNKNVQRNSDENSKPLEYRDIRKLVAARFPPKTIRVIETPAERRRRERDKDAAALNPFIGESLASLKQQGRKSRSRRHKNNTHGKAVTSKKRASNVKNSNTDMGQGLDRRRHVIYTDLKVSRIQQFENGLKIFDELFQPGTLRAYLNDADRKCVEKSRGVKSTYGNDAKDGRDKDYLVDCLSIEDECEEDDSCAVPRKAQDIGDDWMCQQCGFVNPLNLEKCEICDTDRPKKESTVAVDIAQIIADSHWSVARRRPHKVRLTKNIVKRLRQQKSELCRRDEASEILAKRQRAEADLKASEELSAKLKQETPVQAVPIPFAKIIEIVANCEDIRGCKFATRDTFINLSKTAGEGAGDIAFAIASFFEFGKVIQFVVEPADAEAMNSKWRECKSILEIRKSDYAFKSGSSGEPSENVNPMLRGKRKAKKRKAGKTSVESCVSSWENFPRLHEASVGFLNLTGIPEKHNMYPRRPISSDRWRPTLQDAVSIVEDRLSLMNEGSLLILATRNSLYPTTNGASEINAPVLSKKLNEDSNKLGDHPLEIVGWKRLETFMHCHRGLVHEDADVNGIVIDNFSGMKYFCESDVNDGIWVRLDVYLRENSSDEDGDAQLLAMMGMSK